MSNPRRPLTALGLMSGTSLDGVDAALIETEGRTVRAFGPALTLPYPPTFRARLRAAIGRPPGEAARAVEGELTERHAEAVRELCRVAGLAPAAVDVVGFHGQTVFHRPATGESHQIGDGQRLADAVGIPVVARFREADVAAGGEGAPLVPVYHRARAAGLATPLAVVNIGGVANVTWIGAADAGRPDVAGAPAVAGGEESGATLLAFDTGPGNALLDDWVLAHSGRPFDDGGLLAAEGRADEALIQDWLAHPFFRQRPPKSLDRDAFAFALAALAERDATVGAATLTAFTARAVASATRFFPESPRRWLVCGGGRHNPTLLALLAEAVGSPVEPVESVGWRGDALEAEAFAFLAVRALKGLPLTFPTTTGVGQPQPGGRRFTPRRPRRG